MAGLIQYLNLETLQQLQDVFAAVAQLPIRICRSEGDPLTLPSTVQYATASGDVNDKLVGDFPVPDLEKFDFTAPIVVNRHVVGRITLDVENSAGRVYPRHLRLLGLVANVIARLCQREDELRTRAEELATLYRLTAEFTGQRDLQTVLDLVARTVVEVMHAKGCAIRLLNEDHSELVMKAVANLSPAYLNKGPIIVADSKIDQEVLSSGEPLYIADERTDPRVLYPAEARQEGIVSALLAPLSYKGHPEGVIRLYMSDRHEFDHFEVSLLKAIAGEAAAAIVNARLYQEAMKAAEIGRALKMAGEVQRRMIPAESPRLPGFEIASIYVPCFELGGDFFDFIDLPKGNLGIAVCDVVGKGVRASLLMASIRASLRAHALNVYDMSEVLAKVNRDLCEDILTSDFATMFYGVLDSTNRRFTYANAGHVPPVLFRDGQVCHLNTGGWLLGIELEGHWGHEVMTFKSGDVLMIYTDGLNEAMNFEDVPFGRERAEKAAQTAIAQGQSASGIAKHVLWEMRRFAGLQTRLDDLTMIVIKVL